MLANRLGTFAATAGGVFLQGKFDQLQQSRPFSAVASAFNTYCDMLVNEAISGNGKNRLAEIQARLRNALGDEAYHLIKVIPSLSLILGQRSPIQVQENQCDGFVDAQRRLQYLLCQFVMVISSFSGAPILLFLDDLQWVSITLNSLCLPWLSTP